MTTDRMNQRDRVTPGVLDKVRNSAGYILRRLSPTAAREPPAPLPKIAIVCGSGLGGIANHLDPDRGLTTVSYADIPNFPRPTVVGHAGKLLCGHLTGTDSPVLLFVGRVHFYEGHDMELVSFATRVCKLIGIEIMIVTNAAGGLNPDYSVGDIVLINDHLNLAGLVGFHPLRGPNVDELGTRFPPLSDAYDIDLRRRVHRAWTSLDTATRGPTRRLHEGVYAFAAGPTYETRAECRMLRQLGADVVGMSTVPEIIAARHAGMRVLAMSLVTNSAVLQPVIRGDDPALLDMSAADMDSFLGRGKANHEEVLEAGREAAATFELLVQKFVQDVGSTLISS